MITKFEFWWLRGRSHMTHITMLTHPGNSRKYSVQRPLFWILLTQRGYRAVWYFYGADNSHAVSPGSAARKCRRMRERCGRVRRPLFQILAPTAQLMRRSLCGRPLFLSAPPGNVWLIKPVYSKLNWFKPVFITIYGLQFVRFSNIKPNVIVTSEKSSACVKIPVCITEVDKVNRWQ